LDAAAVNSLSTADWLGFFAQLLVLSLLSVGGAITTVADLHRYVVTDKGWIDDSVFSASVALAQAAPGPNLMFVPVVGFQVAGLPGAAVALLGMLVPSTLLALNAARWIESRRQTRGVRAFVAGMAPITLGLILATGWVLMMAVTPVSLGVVITVTLTVLVSLKTKLPPVLWVALGAAAGAAGWV
jgi:chromate transporter